jgi:hypothetical protein
LKKKSTKNEIIKKYPGTKVKDLEIGATRKSVDTIKDQAAQQFLLLKNQLGQYRDHIVSLRESVAQVGIPNSTKPPIPHHKHP